MPGPALFPEVEVCRLKAPEKPGNGIAYLVVRLGKNTTFWMKIAIFKKVKKMYQKVLTYVKEDVILSELNDSGP